MCGHYSIDVGHLNMFHFDDFGDKPENVNIQGISEVRMLPCVSLLHNAHSHEKQVAHC